MTLAAGGGPLRIAGDDGTATMGGPNGRPKHRKRQRGELLSGGQHADRFSDRELRSKGRVTVTVTARTARPAAMNGPKYLRAGQANNGREH